MRYFLSFNDVVVVPTKLNIDRVFTPKCRKIITENAVLVFSHGYFPTSMSPIEWYMLVSKRLSISKEDVILFDSEPSVQLVVIPPRDRSGILKIDKHTVKEFNAKYPLSEKSIAQFSIHGSEEFEKFKSILEEIPEEDLYIGRYAPNFTMRVIDAKRSSSSNE